MNRTRYARLREIFAVLRPLDPASRAERLASLVAEDASLRSEIESLLADSDVADAFLARPAPGDGFSLEAWVQRDERGEIQDDSPPASIGGYAIHSVIASGGMGIVYRAEQKSPRRVVALKVLHADLVGEDARRRFEREAEALGRLQHPGIAAVYEFGSATTPFGECAFLAMEYVEGRTILDHAKETVASTTARVELLALVCDAVHHAHQRGIVHRDLKPANVVVGLDSRPRVLDFGLALLADGDARPLNPLVEGSELAGTLPYMSPERLSEDPDAVDTRGDIYALGVLGHELLACCLPFRIDDPSVPGVLLAISRPADMRAARAIRAKGVDLATVIRKAIARDPVRRYASAAALADDLRRVVRLEPIAARPASAMYQLAMLARRHATATILVVSAVGAGLVGTTWGWIDAARSRTLAERRHAEAVRSGEEAHAEAKRANAVRDLVLEALREADPLTGLAQPSVASVLERAAEALDSTLEDEPETEADLRYRLGVTFRSLGRLESAAIQIERAVTLRERSLGPDHPKSLEAAQAAAIVDSDRGRHEAAERQLVRILGAIERTGEPDAHFAIDVRTDIALETRHLGRFAEAEALYRDVIERWIRLSSPSELHLVRCRSELGSLLLVLGRSAEAETMFRSAIELGERHLGARHDWMMTARNGLAQAIERDGRRDESIAIHERLLADRRSMFGEDHPETLESLHNLASAYGDAGRVEDAVELLRETVAARSRIPGVDHPRTLATRNNLAQLLRRQGALDEAESTLREIVSAGLESLPPGNWQCAVYRANLGGLLLARGKFEEAEDEIRAAHQSLSSALGSTHPRTAEARNLLARLESEKGRTNSR